MRKLRCSALLLALFTAAPRSVKADDVRLDNVIFNISLTETAMETLMAAAVTMQIGNNAAVGGVAVVNADKIHFTFPFAIALDNRFTAANAFQAPITLQDLLNNVLATTLGSPHQNGLDGGDPISYALGAGDVPIGAFSSDPGTDDDPMETERDSWVTTLQRQIGQNSILRQSYMVNYTVISPAEGGVPGEGDRLPEPSSWVLSGTGLIAASIARRKLAQRSTGKPKQ